MGHDQDKGSDLPYPIAPQALWILSAKLAGPGSTILSAEAKFSISVHLTGLDGLASDGTAALIFSQCQKTWLETWSREPQFRYYCLVISDHSFTVLDYFSNFSTNSLGSAFQKRFHKWLFLQALQIVLHLVSPIHAKLLIFCNFHSV